MTTSDERPPIVPNGTADALDDRAELADVVGRRRRGPGRSVSSRAIARLIKGVREGGFVPQEIIIEATGEVRLMASAGAQRPVRTNDFDADFG